jgi:hypothetical protein
MTKHSDLTENSMTMLITSVTPNLGPQPLFQEAGGSSSTIP